MAKKIYDIKPPKVAKKIEKNIKEFLAEDKPQRRKAVARAHKKDGRPVWVPVSIAGGAVLLVVIGILFFKLPRADITIWPKVEVLSYEETVSADRATTLSNQANAVIPAELFQATKTESQEFLATGNASDEGYASGTITIYNKADPVTPFTFRAGTHFLSDTGKLFKAPSKIVIPAAKKSGGKIIPGSVQVKVQAVEGGDSYNIAPSNFSVPGLKGTSSYYSVYASSTEPMTGGYAGKVKKVTESDISEAKEVLTEKVKGELLSALKAEVPADYVLLEDAVSSTIVSASSQKKAGTVTEKFNYDVSGKASGLAFKKSDLEKFAKEYIISQMPDGKKLLESSFKIDYSVDKADISGGKLTLKITFSSGVYQNADSNSMAMSFLGQNENQINQTVQNSLGESVSKIKIKFWPFWVKAAPNSQKAVHVNLQFE